MPKEKATVVTKIIILNIIFLELKMHSIFDRMEKRGVLHNNLLALCVPLSRLLLASLILMRT